LSDLIRAKLTLRQTIDTWAAARPDLPFVLPFLVYLILMQLRVYGPPSLMPLSIVICGLGAILVAGAFTEYHPKAGRPYWIIAIVIGAFAGWGWMAGQHFFEQIGLGGRLPGYALLTGAPGESDLRDQVGAGKLFAWVVGLRMVVAVLVVPIVEELFWRGFLLRLLIDGKDFRRVPIGKFTWFSFVVTSLLSTLQHPDNWMVSILCWMLFNAVLYVTKSLPCVMILHGVTNLVLYALVIGSGEWRFI
jgi:CAAX prenyl protease-like protein